MQQHVESLLHVVGRTQNVRSGHTSEGSSNGDKEAKVSNLSDEDDIEAYLTTFETMIVAYEVPKECRVFRLVSQREGAAVVCYDSS